LVVWMITGDGDGLSIGGNHLMHMLRRNVDVNILLFNNRVYGLTKGQYSPTSPVGTRTKTTPSGSIDNPINPVLFALGAEATFIARTVDTNPKHMIQVFKAAQEHKGVSFVEIFQNCVIFNNKTWEPVYGRQSRDDNLLRLEPNQPMVFGKEEKKGISWNGSTLEIVKLGDTDSAEENILVHKPDHPGSIYTAMLAEMEYPDFPTPIGILRQIEKPTYDSQIHEQVKEAQASDTAKATLQDIVYGPNTWTI